MKIESFLFWTAVAGDLVLFFYAGKHAFRAIKLFRENLAKSLWSASAACGLLGFAMLLPWSLVVGDPVIGRLALSVCAGVAVSSFVVGAMALPVFFAPQPRAPKIKKKQHPVSEDEDLLGHPFHFSFAAFNEENDR